MLRIIRTLYPTNETQMNGRWLPNNHGLTHWPLGSFNLILDILGHFRYFKLIIVNGGLDISYKIALRWMPLGFTDDESTLVQVMAWCRQATSHYLSQCWPRSMSPNGVTRPQWFNDDYDTDIGWLQSTPRRGSYTKWSELLPPGSYRDGGGGNSKHGKTAPHGPLARYVKLRVALAPWMPGTFSPPPTSKETAS